MSAPDFDPAALAKLENLELIAKQLVEGFLAGRHRSPYHGFSVEYLDHRAYVPGDDLRALDWKMVARSDKYYVKLFEAETNLRAQIVVDASQSMAFAGRGQVRKHTYACQLAAALAYLLLKQNDAVGLSIVADALRAEIPPAARATQLRAILAALVNHAPAGATQLGPLLEALAQRARRRGLVIIISDLLDDEAAMARALAHLKHAGHEVLVFHLLDADELEFPYLRRAQFTDPESGATTTADGRRLRSAYRAGLEAFLARTAECALQRRVGYQRIVTSEPCDRALATFLDRRARYGG